LTGDRLIARGCYHAPRHGDGITWEAIVDCGQPHDGEFAGILDAPEGPYPDAAAFKTLSEHGCRPVGSGGLPVA
jgi:hypothetical protein